jgi:hypothetical protein
MKKNYFFRALLIVSICFGINVNAQITWTGSTNSDWTEESNWSTGSVPDNVTDDVVIPNVTNDPIINSANITIFGNLTLQTGATLAISNGGSLKHIDLGFLSSSIVNDGSIILNSGSEFKTDFTVSGSGNFTYNRNLPNTDWYLVSSPFEGQDIDAFISAENLATANSDVGLAPYVTATNIWNYVQTGASGTGNFVTGKGYSVKSNSAGDISFTGTLLTSNKAITLETTGQGYNLIGNPYPIHIKSSSLLSRSSASLDSETIWVWNDDVDTYQAKTSGTGGWNVAPTQSFFVKSDGATGNVSIYESDQISVDDTFLRTDPLTKIGLTLSDGSISRQASVYYIDGTTTGFDNGYDGPRFMAGDNNFAFYTHLVSDSEGVDYDIQALPTDNYENMIIPVGINAVAGTDITIDASITDFPEGINVYLEDQEDNSFTLLDADSNFTTTLLSDINGIGRFYLHTTSDSLSSSDDILNSNNISMYMSSKENLRIVGVQNGITNINIYNILAKKVLKTSFEGTGVNDVKLPSLAKGIYVVRLSTDTVIINKKVIIQ